MENDYQFRGQYDTGELDRINTVLAQQNAAFNQIDQTENSFKKQASKYGVILLGATVIFMAIKLIKK